MTERATAAGELPRRQAGDPTGDTEVDAVLADLDRLDSRSDPAAQLPVLMAVHDRLQRRLTATEA